MIKTKSNFEHPDNIEPKNILSDYLWKIKRGDCCILSTYFIRAFWKNCIFYEAIVQGLVTLLRPVFVSTILTISNANWKLFALLFNLSVSDLSSICILRVECLPLMSHFKTSFNKIGGGYKFKSSKPKSISSFPVYAYYAVLTRVGCCSEI